jgi:hypothetical protein
MILVARCENLKMTRLTPNAKAFAVRSIEDWLLCSFVDD